MSSHTQTKTVRPADTTRAWDQLVEQVEAFLAAWRGDAAPPSLAQFLTAERPEVRRMTLVELIKADLEQRRQDRRAPKIIEDYVTEFPELVTNGEVPCDLIYEEYHVRRQMGDNVDVDNYCTRFPQQAQQLRRLLDLEEPHLTTTMVGAEPKIKIDVGQQLDDFDLLTELGKGAFASVFLARQKSMQRLVALKVSADRGSEPQTLAQLDHPHIVRVYDQRLLPDRKLRLLYMQHIPGGTLQAVVDRVHQTPATARTGRLLLEVIDAALEKRGESPPSESSTRRRLAAARWPEAVCWLGSRLAAALDYAHRQGVLHRDVKPANVLLSADGAPKLADFNVSFSSKLDGATPAAYFGGSLAYMSPEQLEAADPDHPRQADELDGQSDVYSLAVMLWELTTGTRPFGDESFAGSWAETLQQMTARRKQGVGPGARAQLPRDLPPGLEQVLLACLSPDAAQRPASAGQLARQLELCLQPRVQRLLLPTAEGWRQRLRRWPIIEFLVLGMAPQVMFGVFNAVYNFGAIIDHLSPADQDFFKQVEVPVVNGVSYPLGFGLAIWLAWSVLQAVQRKVRGQKLGSAPLPELRHRSLWLADYITWIALALWVVSGVVFPLWSRWHVGSDSSLEMHHYVHFLISQILTGLIASTQTYFLLAFLCVRRFYPLLLDLQTNQTAEADWLARLGRRCGIYFGVAVSAPFISLMLMAMSDTQFRLIIGGLAALGFVGSLLAFWLLRTIQGDLAALTMAVDPTRDPLSGGTDTVDSFWTGSR